MIDFLIGAIIGIGRWFAYEVVYTIFELIVPEKHRAIARRMSVIIAFLVGLALCLACSLIVNWPGV